MITITGNDNGPLPYIRNYHCVNVLGNICVYSNTRRAIVTKKQKKKNKKLVFRKILKFVGDTLTEIVISFLSRIQNRG